MYSELKGLLPNATHCKGIINDQLHPATQVGLHVCSKMMSPTSHASRRPCRSLANFLCSWKQPGHQSGSRQICHHHTTHTKLLAENFAELSKVVWILRSHRSYPINIGHYCFKVAILPCRKPNLIVNSEGLVGDTLTSWFKYVQNIPKPLHWLSTEVGAMLQPPISVQPAHPPGVLEARGPRQIQPSRLADVTSETSLLVF